MAYQMANYVYLIVDTKSKKAVVVDGGGWDVDGIFSICEKNGWAITDALFTHRHFDHTGGKLPKMMTGGRDVTLPGVSEFVQKGVRVHIGEEDRAAVAKQSGLRLEILMALREGSSVRLGDSDVFINTLATPGHTPGSVCFQLNSTNNTEGGVLFTGDTLFIGSCGRVDLPESDVNAMLASLARLSRLSPTTLVLPGHNYAAPAHSSIGQEKEINMMMQQAVARSDKSTGARISSEPVCALLPLPDYLGVARSVFHIYKQRDNNETNGNASAFDDCCRVKASQLESHF
eukprot:CAMPEP_0204828188 /NCGR_PEP_ID=MMETSP1346-20131115/5836_1 /ASSEMBLY_ACC=CAM_ASM_000771 /TAXON_ID=215587 /ORGANISM="Aplanochytrium stocchinoi, Strain GSBS06" /LENGTH=287 /DNA_ID=CAMNT_0051957067 /DNA_START=249 /DNA_END=1112 /DNA_ORIENTATION=-